jgi:RHS repeat-associated protein
MRKTILKYSNKILILIIFSSINIISAQNGIYISGPSIVDSSSEESYQLENINNHQPAEADWKVEFVDDQSSAGYSIPIQTGFPYFESLIRFSPLYYYIDKQADVIATVLETNGNVFSVTKRITIRALNPFYISPNINVKTYNETTLFSLKSKAPIQGSYTATWSLSGSSTVISSSNSSLEVFWDNIGAHTVTCNIIYSGKLYSAIRNVQVEPPYRKKPLIIGKNPVELNVKTKYDLKIEFPNQVQTTWSAVGGTIIEQDNTGAIVNWTSTIGGTIYASVDYNDGIDSYVAELEVTKAPNAVSPYSRTTSTNENYIKTTVFQEPIQTYNSSAKKMESITYIDALGRSKQIIALEAGGNKENIITHIEYDEFGQQTKEFLPYASSTSSSAFRTQGVNETYAFYNTNKYENTLNPFAETQFYGSLGRVSKKSAPGEDWDAHILDEHTIRTEYDVAKNKDNVLSLGVQLNGFGVPILITTSTTYEGVGKALYKVVNKNENWKPSDGKNNTTEEYTDYQNRMLLKRTYNDNEPHDTYYVYDDYENLVFVIPPKVTFPVSNEEMANLCYQYKYDHRNRLIEKKIPGKGQEYIVYDVLDRPVLTQDANLKAKLPEEWLFTKYDNFGRVIYTGIYTATSNSSRSELQTNFDSMNPDENYESKVTSGSGYDGIYYTNNNFPNSNIEVLTVNYYDNYTFNRDGATTTVTAYNVDSTLLLNGLITGSRIKVLEENEWITTVNYYDEKGRQFYTYSKNNYLETTDIVQNKLDFVGTILETKATHKKIGKTDIVAIDIFTYDHQNRIISQNQCIGDHTLTSCNSADADITLSGILDLQDGKTIIEGSNSITLLPNFYVTPKGSQTVEFKTSNGDPEQIVANIYDELGKLVSKKVGNKAASPLQTIDYTYNVRNWLTEVNNDTKSDNDLFNFSLKYNNPSDVSKKLYNGNISETAWNTASSNPTSNAVSNNYSYTYDALNRITGAKDNTKRYNLGTYNASGALITPIRYDKNGNILNLERGGHIDGGFTSFGLMDNLKYTYANNGTSNQLIKVEELTGGSTLTGFKDGPNTGNDYTYDVNGNMKTDKNKKITSIAYNYLNLPTKVIVNNNNVWSGGGDIRYVYDASGVKLAKIVSGAYTNKTTKYAGNYIYEDRTTIIYGGSVTTSELQFFNHPEGYVQNNNGIFNYVYQYKDHLGNVRLSYTDVSTTSTPVLEIIEESNYYPFGLKHKGYNNVVSSNGNSTAQKFGFGGKELNEELGLDWHDFGARNYDAALGRWMNIDPLAEVMENHSPFNYGLNNPIYYRDYDGRAPKGMLDPYIVFDGTKNKIYIYDDNDTPNDSSDDVLLGTFDAHNIADSKSQGKWEDGVYEMYDKNHSKTRSSMEAIPFGNRKTRSEWRIYQDSDYGRYGTGGIYRAVNFVQTDGKTRRGMGFHSGRKHRSFFRRATNGCIRTTDACIAAIGDAIKLYGPLTTATVQNNKAVTPRPVVDPISPITPLPITPVPPQPSDPGTIIPPTPKPNPIIIIPPKPNCIDC